MKNLFQFIVFCLVTFTFVQGISQTKINSDVLYYSAEQTKKVDWDNVKIGFAREINLSNQNIGKLKLIRIRQNSKFGDRLSEIDTEVPTPFDAIDKQVTEHYTNMTKSVIEFDFLSGINKGKLPPLWYAKLPKIHKIREFSGIFLDIKGSAWIDTLTEGSKIYYNKFTRVDSTNFMLDGYSVDKTKLSEQEFTMPAQGEAITIQSVQKAQAYKANIRVENRGFIKSINGDIAVQESSNAFGQTVDRSYKDFFYIINLKSLNGK